MRKQIEALERGSVEVVSPVNTAVNLETLKSGTPEQEVIATILERLELVEQGMYIISKTYEPSVSSRAFIESHPAYKMMMEAAKQVGEALLKSRVIVQAKPTVETKEKTDEERG